MSKSSLTWIEIPRKKYTPVSHGKHNHTKKQKNPLNILDNKFRSGKNTSNKKRTEMGNTPRFLSPHRTGRKSSLLTRTNSNSSNQSEISAISDSSIEGRQIQRHVARKKHTPPSVYSGTIVDSYARRPVSPSTTRLSTSYEI